MQVGGAVVTQRLQVVGLEDPEHLERRHALAVRWQLPDAVALKVRRDRLDPLRTVVAQVVAGEVAPQGLHPLRNPTAELAAVQRARPLLGDESKRAGQVRVPEPRSEERRVGKECRSRWWPDHEKKKEESE